MDTPQWQQATLTLAEPKPKTAEVQHASCWINYRVGWNRNIMFHKLYWAVDLNILVN